MKAAEVIEALRRRHGGHKAREWAFIAELRVGTGYRTTWAGDGPQADNPEQRIDAWAINLWPSRNLLTVAYEVKVSRGDFLAELKQPEKRKQAMALSNLFCFAAPVGLIRPDELPPECGLIEVAEDGTSRQVANAALRECQPPTWRFLASIARRATMAEGRHA